MGLLKKFLSLFSRRKPKFFETLKAAINEALVELKASALRKGANAVIGYDIKYTNVTFNGRDM